MPPGSGIDPMQVIYVVAALNSLGLTVALWRHRDRRGALPLCGVNLGAAVWAGSVYVLTIVDPGRIAHLFLALVFLGVGLSSVTMLVFTLEYTGRERYVRPSVLAALSIEPILTVLFVLVNPNQLFFTLRDGGVEWGIAAGIHTAYSYAVLLVVTVLMLEFLYRSRSLYRGQSAALLVGTLATWIANAAYIVGPIDVDTSPIGFIVTGLLFTVAIVRYRLADVIPIARDRILDTATDGIFVVDDRDRVIDANPVGRALLTDVDASPIGASVHTLFADWPSLRDEYQSLTATLEPTERELEVDGEHYLVRTTPIDDGRDRHVGWLFVVRDVTERKRHQERLERQNERLEEFAGLVSHDLRNPLTVASGYLDLARDADDPEPHFEKIARAHDRMETIIEDVLTLAREGSAVTDPRPVDLAAVAERAWEGVETDDATLEIRSTASIRADPDRLQRLLENLFRNAVEHGSTSPDSHARQDAVEHGSTSPDSHAQREALEEGSTYHSEPVRSEDAVEHGVASSEAEGSTLTVTVGSGADPGVTGVAFYVEDDGPGIPSDRRDRIFEAGYSTDEDGTGFGLRIVQQIADAHGWTVTATEGTAGGARFEFGGVEPDDDPSDRTDGSAKSS